MYKYAVDTGLQLFDIQRPSTPVNIHCEMKDQEANTNVDVDEIDTTVIRLNPNEPSVEFTDQSDNIAVRVPLFTVRQKLTLIFLGVFLLLTVVELVFIPGIFDGYNLNATAFTYTHL